LVLRRKDWATTINSGDELVATRGKVWSPQKSTKEGKKHEGGRGTLFLFPRTVLGGKRLATERDGKEKIGVKWEGKNDG